MTMINFNILGECECGQEVQGFQCAFGRVLITRIRVDSSISFFKPCQCLARQADRWPHQAIYPADLLRMANQIEHQGLIDAANDRSLDWPMLLAVLEEESP